MTCPYCGLVFNAQWRGQVYCCRICGKKAAKQRARSKRNPAIQIVCAICHTTALRYQKNGGGRAPKTCGSRECVRQYKIVCRKRWDKLHPEKIASYKIGERGRYIRNPIWEEKRKQWQTRAWIKDVAQTISEIRRRIMIRDSLFRCYRCDRVLSNAERWGKTTSLSGLCKTCESSKAKAWRIAHPSQVKARQEGMSKRMKADARLRIAARIRARTISTIKRQCKSQHCKMKHVDYLGCTKEQARAYIEAQFIKGMTWANYGKAWEIDHVFPCSKYDLTQESERRKAFHYTNLRPLWARANRHKHAKILHKAWQPRLLLCNVIDPRQSIP